MSLSASSSLSVRPSVRPPVWARLPVARFSRNLTLGGGLWWKYVQQFQVWLKSDRNIGHSARRRTCVSPWQHYETLCSVRTVRAPSGVSAAPHHASTLRGVCSTTPREHLPGCLQHCSTTPRSLWQKAKLLPNVSAFGLLHQHYTPEWTFASSKTPLHSSSSPPLFSNFLFPLSSYPLQRH